jgi:hypothetical protein
VHKNALISYLVNNNIIDPVCELVTISYERIHSSVIVVGHDWSQLLISYYYPHGDSSRVISDLFLRLFDSLFVTRSSVVIGNSNAASSAISPVRPA